MSHLLARFRRQALADQQAAALREAIGIDDADPLPNSVVSRDPATPGNERLLRGIPLFVPGVKFGGVIAGTQPEREALRIDGLRRRRA